MFSELSRSRASVAGRCQTLKNMLDYFDMVRILKHMLNRQPSLDRIFHALADPTRRAVVARLSRGPQSVSELAEPMDMTLAAVVQHLQVLEESGLVRSEKSGRVRTCRIEPITLTAAAAWIADRKATWQRRLDRLGELLEGETPRRGTRKRP